MHPQKNQQDRFYDSRELKDDNVLGQRTSETHSRSETDTAESLVIRCLCTNNFKQCWHDAQSTHCTLASSGSRGRDALDVFLLNESMMYLYIYERTRCEPYLGVVLLDTAAVALEL